MNERERFEEWFKSFYGERPDDIPAELKMEIDSLQDRLAHVRAWQTRYDAALAAWHERHSQDTTMGKEGLE